MLERLGELLMFTRYCKECISYESLGRHCKNPESEYYCHKIMPNCPNCELFSFLWEELEVSKKTN